MNEEEVQECLEVTDWETLMAGVRTPGEGRTKVSLVALADGEDSHIALCVSGPERIKVVEYLLGSLDRLAMAMQQAGRKTEPGLIQAAP